MGKTNALTFEIENETADLENLKSERKKNPKHIEIKELPEEDQFLKLVGSRSLNPHNLTLNIHEQCGLVLCHCSNVG